jgi:hypothetical protein
VANERGLSVRFRGSWETGVEMNAGNRAFCPSSHSDFLFARIRYQIIKVAVLPGDTRLLSKVSEAVLRIGAVFPSRYLLAHIIPRVSKNLRKYPAVPVVILGASLV